MNTDQKLDLVLDKLNKLDSIEQEISGVKDTLDAMKQTISQHDTRLVDIENSLSFNEHEIEDIKTASATNKTEISDLRLRIIQLEALSKRNAALESQLHELESYTRRENLLLDGVPEHAKEDTLQTVKDIFTQKLKLTGDFEIQRCHRLGQIPTKGNQQTDRPRTEGRPRPIIVRFLRAPDRMTVWSNRRLLKGSGIFLREDFAAVIEYRRRSMYPILKLSKTLDEKSHIRIDKLIYKGQKYSLETLPLEILSAGEAGPNAKTKGKYLYFNGRASPFSNFHPSRMVINENTFNCAEQFYQYSKAMFAGCAQVAAQIKLEDDPLKQKGLGDSVRVDKVWYTEVGLDIMKQAIHAKFTQSKKLNTFLKSFRQFTVVECNRSDNYWGIGLAMDNPNIYDCTQWKGKNNLGVVFKEVMNELAF